MGAAQPATHGSTGGILVVQAMHDLGWLSGQTVHNLHVGNVHTYYVATANGNVGAIVHNCAADRQPTLRERATVIADNMRRNGGLERCSNSACGVRLTVPQRDSDSWHR